MSWTCFFLVCRFAPKQASSLPERRGKGPMAGTANRTQRGLEDVHKLIRAAVKLCRLIKHEANLVGQIGWLKVAPLIFSWQWRCGFLAMTDARSWRNTFCKVTPSKWVALWTRIWLGSYGRQRALVLFEPKSSAKAFFGIGMGHRRLVS
jgi:hypothetical protein